MKISKKIMALVLLLSCMLIAQVSAVDVMSNHTTISAGASHSAAIGEDGTLWMWGDYENGQLGVGYGGASTSTPVGILPNIVSVSCGAIHTVALDSSGTLWAWGNNNHGRLGDGTTTNRFSPVQVMTDVIAVSAGNWHNLALKSDGTVWAWGSNAYGQIGNGTENGILSSNGVTKPVQVMSDAVAIYAGGTTSMAIKSDGTLWAWGSNSNGEIGNGTTTNQLTPLQIMSDVVTASVGWSHSAAVKSDGTLWTWGGNSSGQLGDGTTTKSTVPIQVMTNVSKVSASYSFTMVIKDDGTAWSWGSNSAGQLGTNKSFASQIMGNITDIETGNYHALALDGDGKLWSWGRGEDGQLGNGSMSNSNTPVATLLTDIKASSSYMATTQTSTEVETVVIPVTQTTTTAITATLSNTKMQVNGADVAVEAYMISGNNYIKLRDLATMINGTAKNFEVTWNETLGNIELLSGSSYTSVGGEMSTGGASSVSATLNTSPIYYNGIQIELTAYTISGNNYFKLRDVMSLFNVGVGYDAATELVTLDTSASYTA